MISTFYVKKTKNKKKQQLVIIRVHQLHDQKKKNSLKVESLPVFCACCSGRIKHTIVVF